MYSEHEVVRLRQAVDGISAGTVGTIMLIPVQGIDQYLIEFPDPEEKEIRLVSVPADHLEPAN